MPEDKPEQKQTKQKVHFKETKDEFILDSGKYNNFDYGIEWNSMLVVTLIYCSVA